MTTEQFEEALHERGIETERDEQGIVTMLLPEDEFKNSKKYARIVAEIGWERSWGRKVKRGENT
jgi:hypothetical protein